jgi:hypothetical protein
VTSCFSLTHLRRSDGALDQYWHHIEVREQRYFAGYHLQGPSEDIVRARLTLPRGSRDIITKTFLHKLLEAAFEYFIKHPTEEGYECPYLVSIELAIERIRNTKFDPTNSIFFYGYMLEIVQYSGQLMFLLKQLPRYDSPIERRPVAIASCFTRGVLSVCSPSRVADTLMENWKTRTDPKRPAGQGTGPGLSSTEFFC